MNIKVITFNDNIALGTEYVPLRVVGQGDRFGKFRLKLEDYQERFVKITFVHPEPSRTYSQFVPWIRVDTCLFSEETAKHDQPDEAPVEAGAGTPKRRGRPRKDSGPSGAAIS